jgi:hypothetical protein
MKQTKDSPGNCVDAPKEEFSLISNDTLLALYHNLLKSRIARSRPNRVNGRRPETTWPFDAAVVALANDLVAEDAVIAEAHNPVLQVLRANTWDPHPAASRLNGVSHPGFSVQLQAAAGAALAHKTKKTGKVSVVFGRRGDSQAWLDTLEIARAHRLPMIFVIDADALENGANRSSRQAGARELMTTTSWPCTVLRTKRSTAPVATAAPP